MAKYVAFALRSTNSKRTNSSLLICPAAKVTQTMTKVFQLLMKSSKRFHQIMEERHEQRKTSPQRVLLFSFYFTKKIK